MDLVTYIDNDPDYSQAASALTLSGLANQLRGNGPFTVFLPNNAAFAKVPQNQLLAIESNQTELQNVLKYHIVQGEQLLSQIMGLTTLPTLEGENLNFSSSGGQVTINGTAKVVEPDVKVSNGVIQGIDTVLLPPSLASPSPSASPSASGSPGPSPSASPSPSATSGSAGMAGTSGGY